MEAVRKIFFSLRFDGDDRWPICARDVKCGMEIDHKHTYLLRVKYCL
jgi:hypothetical protein